MKETIWKDLKYILSGSGIMVSVLVIVMIYSPLALQFNEDGAGRGEYWKDEVSKLLLSNQPTKALNIIDSLINEKSKDLNNIAYFDRFLPEDQRIEASIARADIYDLQWVRFEILQTIEPDCDFIGELERYAKIFGYNQEKAETLLNKINR